MLIANPIYDIVFKYLMEDLDIAKDLLSLILNTEIVSLTVKPQETTSEVKISDKMPINIYRLDFVAVFQEADGSTKKALVELQKSKRSTNISRFRKYLGESYKKEDKILENGIEIIQPLEIITIYLLGFELEDVDTAVMKVKNCFIDVLTGKSLPNEPKDKFIRLLNHESYTIQIPKLQPNEQNQIEKTLNVFNQNYRTDDEHILNYQGNVKDPLMIRIINRLTRAIADDDLRRQMDVEDEIETELQSLDNKIEDIKQELVKSKEELSESKQIIEKKEQIIEKSKKELSQSKQIIKKNKEELEKNKEELDAKDKEIEELRKLLKNKI